MSAVKESASLAVLIALLAVYVLAAGYVLRAIGVSGAARPAAARVEASFPPARGPGETPR